VAQVGSLTYALPPAIAVAIGIAIISLVLKWAPPSRTRGAFLVMVAGLVLWGAVILGMRMSTSPETALKWDQWVGVAVLLLYLGFYHFSLEYVNVLGPRRALVAGYVSLVFFAVAAPAGLLVEDIRVEDYGYAPVPGPLAMVASAIGTALLLAGTFALFRSYRATSSYEERNRLLYIMVGAAFPLLGAALDLFSNLPPVGIWTSILFCGITAVALLGYRLLDIPQVARRTLTYLVLGTTVALPYVVVLLALQRLLGERFDSLWTAVLSVLVLAILLRPLYAFAQDSVDRLFFRDRYDALRALEQFGKELQYSVSLESQSAHLSKLVTEALRASSAYLLLPNRDRTAYRIVSTGDPDSVALSGSVNVHSPLARWFAERPWILAQRYLDIEPALQSLPKNERELLDRIGTNLLVPISSRDGRLSGLLLLGPKRSHGEYSGDDRRLLEALGRQLALALENTRLYEDALRARRDLEAWLDGMHDSVVIVGDDQTVRFVNRAARENLGVRIGDLCSAVLGSREQCDSCSLTEPEAFERGHMRLARRIAERDFELVSAPLRDPDGQPAIIAVFRDVTERLRFEEELRRSKEQMRELAAHIESVREEERMGIARELHDELGQLLTALKMDISWLSSRLVPASHPSIAEKLQGMRTLADTTIVATQRISSELRPGLLDDLGLVAGLEWLVREFQDRSGIGCRLDVDAEVSLNGAVSTALFRICQESLTNTARHSGADRVTVSLLVDSGRAFLSIQDNGCGVSDEQLAHSHSFGLIGMRERARAIGGDVRITGEQGRGTCVEVSVPVS